MTRTQQIAHHQHDHDDDHHQHDDCPFRVELAPPQGADLRCANSSEQIRPPVVRINRRNLRRSVPAPPGCPAGPSSLPPTVLSVRTSADLHVHPSTKPEQLPIFTTARHQPEQPRHPARHFIQTAPLQPGQDNDDRQGDPYQRKQEQDPHPRITIPWCPSRALAGPLGTLHKDRQRPEGNVMTASTNPRRGDCRDARRPTERSAAIMLAAAQRDLALARASSPAAVAAAEPEIADPHSVYANWVELMEAGERHARKSALRSVAAGRSDDDSPHQFRPLLDPAFAHEHADAVRRARAAIAAMTGRDPAAAEAARHDVLVRWPADDDAVDREA